MACNPSLRERAGHHPLVAMKCRREGPRWGLQTFSGAESAPDGKLGEKKTTTLKRLLWSYKTACS
ncbi:hypothetical protein L345_15171, partial [Ophiophagus hannah]